MFVSCIGFTSFHFPQNLIHRERKREWLVSPFVLHAQTIQLSTFTLLERESREKASVVKLTNLLQQEIILISLIYKYIQIRNLFAATQKNRV